MLEARHVEPELERLLPAEVIDYVWRLALMGERCALPKQWLYLCPHPFKPGVQQVAHTYGHTNFRRWSATRCAAPVTCHILVEVCPGGYRIKQVSRPEAHLPLSHAPEPMEQLA